MSFWETIFWLSLLGIFYVYAGYPLIIGWLAWLFPRPVKATSIPPVQVSVIISCHRETNRLGEKLANMLASDEVGRIREILVGLDGDPGEALEGIPTSPVIQIITFPERRGKPAVLNDLIPRATGDILVMMDVRQRLDPGALPALIKNFSDPSVGVVSGELVFESGPSGVSDASTIAKYWQLEKWLRLREGRFASVPGATGALYAIRRELALPVPEVAALDDVIIPMQAIAQGFRCIFEPGARIYDQPARDASREAIRKRRTLAGCVQLLTLYPRWFLPFGHPIWWQFASHKTGRLFSPFLLGLAGIANAHIFAQPLYTITGLGQLLLYTLAIVSMSLKQRSSRPTQVIRPLGVFLHMQFTLLQAWRDGLFRANLARWDRAVEG